MVAKSHRVADSLHRECVARNLLVAKEIGCCPHAQHQVVVVNGADRGLNSFFFFVDRLHLSHAEIVVGIALEQPPDRKRDVAGLQTSRGYLVDEWRELVVVVFVYDYHLKA